MNGIDNGELIIDNCATRNRVRRRAIFWIALASLSIINYQLSIAQHYVGLKAGYGGASGRFYPLPDKKGIVWNKLSGGVVWRHFTEQQVLGGMGLELEFQQRGYRVMDGRLSLGELVGELPDGEGFVGGNNIVSDSTTYRVTTRSVSSITMPLLAHPHLYLFNRTVRLFGTLGASISYNTGLGDQVTTADHVWNENTRTHTVLTKTEPYKMQIARDVRWNYGLVMGGGLGVLVGRMEFFAEGRYYWGLSDILRYKSKYLFHDGREQDKPMRTELNNIFVSVGVTFRLGKGDITEQPWRRGGGPPPGDSDFRNIKVQF